MAKQAENVLIPNEATINVATTLEVLSIGLGVLLIIVIWFSFTPKPNQDYFPGDTYFKRIATFPNLLRIGVCSILLILLIPKIYQLF